MADRIMALDAGFANCGVAIFELCSVSFKDAVWSPCHLECISTHKEDSGEEYVAIDDANRMVEMARRLRQLETEYNCKWLMAELPGGGGQSARAVRAMALCSGMIAGLCSDMGYEFFIPSQTRAAAGVPREIKKGPKVKKIVTSSMRKIYPMFCEWEKKNTKAAAENVADALSCFEAAKVYGKMLSYITPLAGRA